MNKTLSFLTLFIYFLNYSQCNSSSGCNPNNGLYSGNDPENIEYDNIVSSFHATTIKDAFNNHKVWGSDISTNGIDPVLSPQYINATNYPGLTGDIKKVALGSNNFSQLIILTTDGLFVCGKPEQVIPVTVKSTSAFEKISINGKLDGLPAGVNPLDVKMLFATSRALMLTTCDGYVYVLSELSESRGNGYLGNSNEWAQVMENATTPLSDVVVARGQFRMGLAVKRDGTIWTWGSRVYSGANVLNFEDFGYATKMVLPAGANGVKMIQATSYSSGINSFHSYYLLDKSNTLYCLGFNNQGQLGFVTPSAIQKTWAIAKYPDGRIMNDIVWISSNEHDSLEPNISVINKMGTLYTAGSNSRFMIGRDKNFDTNFFGIPKGVSATDIITISEVGGHCTAITKKGTNHYGYVGHRIMGSMGDGTMDDLEEKEFDFIKTPEVYICGLSCPDPMLENNSPVCYQNDASFTIKSTPNDEITYSINNENDQIVTIDGTGKFEISIPSPNRNQVLKIKKIKNLICGEKILNITSNSILINNTDIKIIETNNNTINIVIQNGTPDFLYQLSDKDGIVIYPWQSSNTFSNLTSNYYKIEIKTSGTNCISTLDFVFLNIPNVITPNNDGKNDELPLAFFQKLSNSYLDIFDRFGKKLLHLDKNRLRQDYSAFNTGTYWYIFSDETGKIKKGWIFIKKR